MLMIRALLAALLVAAVGANPIFGPVVAASPGPAQRGFALIWHPDYTGPQLAQSLGEMAEVGATWVQFTPTWGQPTVASSMIAPTPRTVSDANLEGVIGLAHQRGLKVFLKPHLELPNPEVQSRSTIRPADPGAWFDSYVAFIGHYADLAQRLGVEQFSVGSELSAISGDRPGWLRVIAAVRDRYRGTVLYAADPDEYRRVPFWDALDLIGIDAYFPLAGTATADAAALQRSWQPIRADLAAFSASTGRRILFSEAGYTSQEGTTTAPADWTLGTQPSEAEQAAAYQSVLATFGDQDWWAGVYWWVWNALPDDGSDHATNYSPRGKAAERVIRGWWSR